MKKLIKENMCPFDLSLMEKLLRLEKRINYWVSSFFIMMLLFSYLRHFLVSTSAVSKEPCLLWSEPCT